MLTQLPVIVSSWDNEAGPPLPQSKDMEASVELGLFWLTVKWAPLKEMDDLLVKLPENPSLMPTEPAMPVASLAQTNLPVEEFQVSLLLEAVQDVKPAPYNCDAEAKPAISKSLEAETLFEIVILPESLEMVSIFRVAISMVAADIEAVCMPPAVIPMTLAPILKIPVSVSLPKVKLGKRAVPGWA